MRYGKESLNPRGETRSPVKLFHFSEEPGIARFEPHVPATQPDAAPLVWAIDEEHAPHYLFPRDCPRICFWTGPAMTAVDRERFFGGTTARKVIAIEGGWLERVRAAKLHMYEFPPASFSLHDEFAGYYVSAVAVIPTRVEPVEDLLGKLVSSGIELRLTPSLWPLHDALVSSTVPFSMIRMRNLAPRAVTG